MNDEKVYVYTYTSPNYDKDKEYVIRELNIKHKLTDYEREWLFGVTWKQKLINFYNRLKNKWRRIL